jgi:hypothetical protein
MEQPTALQWAIFLLSMGLTVYAFWHLGSGLLSRVLPAREQPQRSSAPAEESMFWVVVERLSTFLIRWFYGPILKAVWRLLVFAWELPGLLWRGSREADPPAPVLRLSVGLPVTYVTSGTQEPHQNAPSARSAVCLSAPSAAEQPVSAALPAELERLMVDTTREALIEALLIAGWNVGQIRAQLRGDNGKIGQEIEAARARLAAREAPRETPIAGRATAAEFPKQPPSA